MTLRSLLFDNRNLRILPVDNGPRLISRPVKNSVFSFTDLQPVTKPSLVSVSPSALQLLGIPYKEIISYTSQEIEDVEYFLGGNKIIPGSTLAAHVYCGHQFGSFAGQLGDGAAMYLGEVIGLNNVRWELQLKGAGLTPFSRTADGRKVLRSSIREFLGSEALHYLNIPTTRAASIVTSDSTVVRDQFYDNHAAPEKCTIVQC